MGSIRPLVFTDLDGTVLDHDTYRPGPAADALRRLESAGVGVVFCSAKTLAEQQALARELGIRAAYVTENGARVDIPASFAGITEAVERIFGLPYEEIRRRLRDAASELGFEVRGYGDMSAEEVAAVTGLDRAAAERAKQRCCTETIVDADPGVADRLADALRRRGLTRQRGARFWTVQGPHDKGRAVRWVEAWLSGHGLEVTTFGVGDAPNDRDLLAAVEHPFLVRRPDGTWTDLVVPRLRRLAGIGPAGFAEAAELILAELGRN